MNEVKLSKKDLDTLKGLYAIDQTLKIVQDNTELRTVNSSKTIACQTHLESAFPRTFCIYDLREFISVVGIIENPVLDFSNDKFVLIKSEDGRQKLRYVDGAENLINSYFEKDFKLPSEDLVVSVTGQQLRNVMNAAMALRLDYVGFKSEDGKVYLCSFDRNNGSGDETNGFSVEVGETTGNFQMFYKSDNLSVLDGDCTFTISSRRISKVENGEKVFWMALDANSTFA